MYLALVPYYLLEILANKKKYLLFAGFALGGISCDSTADAPHENAGTTIAADSITSQERQRREVNTTTDSAQISDCVRGAAEPIVRKSVFSNTTFHLQPDKLTGIETVELPQGDKLIINNYGCEYYALNFQFETSRFQEDTSKVYFWYKTAGALMNGIREGIDAPIDINKGIAKLTEFAKKSKRTGRKLKIGQEVYFGGETIMESVVINRVEKIDDKRYAVEIIFAIGPL